MILMRIAMIILMLANSARKAMMVVIVPAPAMIGKANGTTLAVLPETLSRNKRTPKIISKLIAKMMMEPATANERTSTPNNCKILSPNTKKPIMIPSDTKLVRMG